MSTPQTVVVTDHAFENVDTERRMSQDLGAGFMCHNCTTEDDAVRALEGADVALVNFAPITRRVMTHLKPAATVIRYGIGVDNVDLDAAKALGIQVANVPDYGVETVADHASAGILMLARRLPRYDLETRQLGWLNAPSLGPITGLRSMTVGLVGLGRIALAVRERLASFGCAFVGFDPFVGEDVFEYNGIERVSLMELASRSNAVSLHAPSTEDSYHIVDSEFLGALPKGAILVNTSRGSLVDDAALTDALVEGRLSGAALDVFDPEPLPPKSPLRTAPGVILSPHAAFYDEDSLLRLQVLAAEEAARALRGEPLRCRVI